MNFRQKTNKGKKQEEENPLTAEPVILVDILLHVKKGTEHDGETNVPCPSGEVMWRLIYLLYKYACKIQFYEYYYKGVLCNTILRLKLPLISVICSLFSV